MQAEKSTPKLPRAKSGGKARLLRICLGVALGGYGGMAQIYRHPLRSQDLPATLTATDSTKKIDRLSPLVEKVTEAGRIAVLCVTTLRSDRRP